VAIETVLGPVDASGFGHISMHEHVYGDFRAWYRPGTDAELEHRDVRMENLGFLHWNTVGIADNLLLEDEDTAVAELERLRPTAMNAVVDLTNVNIGRRVGDLAAVSRRSGVHIAVGCGFYIHESHPDWLEGMPEDDVYAFVRGELVDGIDGTGIRPALVGEVGTSERITDRERKALLACGRAAAEVGVCVNVHLDPRGRNAPEVVELLTGVGVPAADVVLSHMQNVIDDWGYHLAVAQTGAVLEYDTFGEEGYYGDLGFASPRDLDRMDLVERFVDAGHDDQLVLGNDVWLKTRLVRYGGCGYAHLATTILTRLRERGIPDESLEKMLRTTPLRVLDRSRRAVSEDGGD
jgi:phosphotriesterase-related protein